MPEVPVASLDPRHQKLIENARIALERGNLDYAIEVTGQVLKAAPGCLPVRRLQRVAQLRQARGKGGFLAKALSSFSTAPFMRGGGKKEPAKLLETAEGLLAKNPASVPALRLLAEAAGGLGLTETVGDGAVIIVSPPPPDPMSVQVTNVYGEPETVPGVALA